MSCLVRLLRCGIKVMKTISAAHKKSLSNASFPVRNNLLRPHKMENSGESMDGEVITN